MLRSVLLGRKTEAKQQHLSLGSELLYEGCGSKAKKTGGLNGRNILSHSSGGQKPKIKVLVPSENRER